MGNTEEIKLCPNCQTGADSYSLDDRTPVCPYLHLHTGRACVKYKQMNNVK